MILPAALFVSLRESIRDIGSRRKMDSARKMKRKGMEWKGCQRNRERFSG